MSRRWVWPTMLALQLVGASAVYAATVDALMAQSRALAGAQQYNQALELLVQAHEQQPNNDDVLLLIARIHGWQGDYDAAERELKAILMRHAEYTDASDALTWVERARTAPPPLLWRLDAGYEHSGFERVTQPDWNMEFLQLSRQLGDATLHGRAEHYDQYRTIDTTYELGADYRFTSRLSGYLLGSNTPNADFRPRWRVGAGGAARLDPEQLHGVPVWFTLDARQDEYTSVSVRTVNPGLRIEPADDWAISPKLITVTQLGMGPLYGWTARLDGRFAPGWRFNAGYADAPETESGVTVTTKTYFGGLAVDINPAYTLQFAYTHDDREKSYIRHVIDCSLSYRF